MQGAGLALSFRQCCFQLHPLLSSLQHEPFGCPLRLSGAVDIPQKALLSSAGGSHGGLAEGKLLPARLDSRPQAVIAAVLGGSCLLQLLSVLLLLSQEQLPCLRGLTRREADR